MGELLKPFAKMAKFMQFGYSPRRLWSRELYFLDPRDKMKKRTFNIRSHIYVGAQLGFPATGIKFNGQDISDIIVFKMLGEAFIDFGDKNDLTPTNIKDLVNDPNKDPLSKMAQFMTSAREITRRSRGSLELALGKVTQQVLPDLKLIDGLDMNILINLGKGLDGDRGSSGLPAGFHVFFSPPPFDILNNYIKAVFNAFAKILKVGSLPAPKLPSITGINMGFHIGAEVHYSLRLGSAFSMRCKVKMNGLKPEAGCKINLDFISIFSEAGKWIAKMGKELIDKTGKKIAEFSNKAGDFAKDISDGAKKHFDDMVDGCKEAYDAAEKEAVKVYNSAANEINKCNQAIGNAAKDCEQGIKDVTKATEKAVNDVVDKFKGPINSLGKGIKDLGNKIGGLLNPKKKRRDKRKKKEKEREKREMEAQRQREIDQKNNEKQHRINQYNDEKNRKTNELNAKKNEEQRKIDESNRIKDEKNNAYQEALQARREMEEYDN